jgi:hypothetical protein
VFLLIEILYVGRLYALIVKRKSHIVHVAELVEELSFIVGRLFETAGGADVVAGEGVAEGDTLLGGVLAGRVGG